MGRFGLAMAALAFACPAQAQDDPGPIAIHGNKQTFEIAPVLLAADEFYPGEATVKMGGIPNLVGDPIVPGFGEEGVADVATHAETQALRYSVRHPDLRIILNVSQGLYRIVARRSAGIAAVADLKGKRIATIPQTSAGYFLQRMLERERLGIADVTAVPMTPLSGMTEALRKGEVDAVVIWEPESEKSAQALGSDLVEFAGDGVYRELFNLNTTAGRLADPAERAKIVRFVHGVLMASDAIQTDPARAQALVAAAGGFSAEDVRDSWRHHGFIADIPADLLDVLEQEEQWLAIQDKRPARSRDELARLIDTSVFDEAVALAGPE
jgi:NitT/TauT family transport system substrate-binding protein